MQIQILGEPVTEYMDGVRTTTHLPALITFVKDHPLGDEATHIVEKWSDGDFIEWRRGVLLESKKNSKGAGEEWAVQFRAVLLPKICLPIGMIASNYCVPQGLAIKRCIDAGLMEFKDGRVTITAAGETAWFPYADEDNNK